MLFSPSKNERPERVSSLEDPVSSLSDLDLAERSATGDRLAFETIYRRHVNRVYGLCLRLTADPVAADTLVQDTFIKAWTSMGGYTGRGNLGGWLARIAVNLQRDQFRQLARREKLAEESGRLHQERQQDSGSVVPMLTAMDLDRGIARLPAGARTVFVLYEVEGYAQREIAALMNVATGTVKAQLHRARRLLRDILSENKGMSQ
jgi:RNA polymerase sigma-70 factor (ECF subfamily)